MKTTLSILLLATTLASNRAVAASSADQQIRFAEHLLQTGDAPFALLEFKRFNFLYPSDQRVASSHQQIADIYFGYFQEVNAGKAALAKIIKEHPKSAEAAEAKATLNLFAVHRGANEKLLLEYLESMRLARTSDAKKAADKLVAFAGRSTDSGLASAALLEAGKLQLTKLKKPQDAMKLFERILQRYPNSAQRDETLFRTGEALEKIEGASPRTVQAYQLAAAKKNPFQQQAKSAIARLQKQLNLPKRQFDAKLATKYKHIRDDYPADTLIVTIELAQSNQTNAIKATMEKALFDSIGKRRDSKHHVVVNAYYSYPITEAGGVNWRVGSTPNFTVKPFKTEDAVKTIIFDLFKKR